MKGGGWGRGDPRDKKTALHGTAVVTSVEATKPSLKTRRLFTPLAAQRQ
jgi:hypothetical protein